MDIFTTFLTNVVQVPIKPEKLKVKALVKDASSSALTDDLYHGENHDVYFRSKAGLIKERDQKKARQALSSEDGHDSEKDNVSVTLPTETEQSKKDKKDKKDKKEDDQPLDVYV